MNIERAEFIAWMERIMERFDVMKEYFVKKQSENTEIDGVDIYNYPSQRTNWRLE